MTLQEIVQIATTVIATIGLCFAARQMFLATQQMSLATGVADRSRRVADLQAMQKFFQDVNEREAALATAVGDPARLHAFNEFLNFLELYAHAYNRDLFDDSSEELVRHKLADSFNVLNENRHLHPLVMKAVDTRTTLIELRTFVERHRPEIDERAKARKERFAEQAALEAGISGPA